MFEENPRGAGNGMCIVSQEPAIGERWAVIEWEPLPNVPRGCAGASLESVWAGTAVSVCGDPCELCKHRVLALFPCSLFSPCEEWCLCVWTAFCCSFIFHSKDLGIHIRRLARVSVSQTNHQLYYALSQRYWRAHVNRPRSLHPLHFFVCLGFPLTFSLVFTASSLSLGSSSPAPFFGSLPFRSQPTGLLIRVILCLLNLVVAPTLISPIWKIS